MNDLGDSRDLEPVCRCHSRCVEVATGVLMARHGLTADQVRDTFVRAAQRQSESLHAWAQQVIDSAVAPSARRAPVGA